MKTQILRLIILALFTLIGGLAAQAQDDQYYIHYEFSQAASFCNEDWFWLGFNQEYNIPEDGEVFWMTFDGTSSQQGTYAVSGYNSVGAYFIIDGPFTTPYYYSRYEAWYSQSGAMISRQFEVLLECNANNQVRVVMSEY